MSAYLASVVDFLAVMHWRESIQAFASVVALILAVWVPLRIRKLDRRVAEDEQRRKAEALAFFITADVCDIAYTDAIRAASFLKVCRTHPKPSYPKQVVVRELSICAADRLQPIAERLWLLEPDCGKAVNRAISLSLYLNRKVNEYFSADDISSERLEQFHSIYGYDLDDVLRNANCAIKLLGKYYDLKADSQYSVPASPKSVPD